MSLDSIPIWIIFTGTVLVVIISIEAGYRLGKIAHRRSEEEKESPVSGVSPPWLLSPFSRYFAPG